jgi:hypothetical protein
MLSYEELFEPNPYMPVVSCEEVIDECVSQCGVNDYWFETHSSGQKLFNKFAETGARESFSRIRLSNSQTILLETTLRVWPRDFDGISELLPSHDDAILIKKTYDLVRPRQEYYDLLDSLEDVDIAVWVRHGDLSYYYKRAANNLQYTRGLLETLKSRGLKIAVFSNDSYLQDILIRDSGLKPLNAYYTEKVLSLPQHRLAALQFFFMALKSKCIIGTPGSSFAQEASLYGGNKYISLSSETDVAANLTL